MGQVCHVGGKILANTTNEQERARRLDNLCCRTAMGYGLFEDKRDPKNLLK
jgi:hypothetical protein